MFAPDQQGKMQFVRAFGGEGTAPGRFKKPTGVAVVRGLVVVCDAGEAKPRTPDATRLQVR